MDASCLDGFFFLKISLNFHFSFVFIIEVTRFRKDSIAKWMPQALVKHSVQPITVFMLGINLLDITLSYTILLFFFPQKRFY